MTADGAFAAVRAIHELAALIAFGQLVYANMIAGAFDPRARKRVLASIVVSLIAACGWLALEAANMSGLPFSEALTRSVVAVVLEETLFGWVWAFRIALGVALVAWLVSARPRRLERDGQGSRATWRTRSITRERERWELRTLLALVALYVATLTLVGHAVAATGAERVFRVAADGVHLLAAGAWLGALPGLALAAAGAARSATAPAIAAAARATRRFSVLGLLCVAALIATGVVNAWFLVGSRLALIGTPYGHWLLLKLAVFAGMVAIAAYNRQRLSPRIGAGDATALAMLARNARIELGLGVLVVAIVGQLGITMPAIHDRAVIPAFLAAGDSAVVLPTHDAVSPAPDSDDVIERGRGLFLTHCASCHGSSGLGDGPAAASLPLRPADLARHGAMHTPGDLWWMIAHGVPGTPMPAFSPGLSDNAIWELVQYVRALSGTRDATPSPIPSPAPSMHEHGAMH